MTAYTPGDRVRLIQPEPGLAVGRRGKVGLVLGDGIVVVDWNGTCRSSSYLPWEVRSRIRRMP